MLVSFIIPVYNGEKYIESCLDSIVSLDRSDYEIVVVDDGSIDNTSLIMQTYQRQYPSIRYLSQKNAGVSAARINGVHAATGSYIFFVDADDLIDTIPISKVMNLLRASSYDVVLGNYIEVDQDEQQISEHSLYQLIENKRDKLDKIYVGDFLLNVCWGKFLRKDIITYNNLLFDTTMKYGEDTIFMGDFLMNTKNFLCTNENFYYYRQTPTNSVNSLRSTLSERYLDETEKLIRKKRDYIEHVNADEEVTHSFIDYYGRHLSATINLVLKQKGTLHSNIVAIGKYLQREQMLYIINQVTLKYGWRRFFLCQIYKISALRNLYIIIKHAMQYKNRR